MLTYSVLACINFPTELLEELLGGSCVYLISNILEVSVETPMNLLNY